MIRARPDIGRHTSRPPRATGQTSIITRPAQTRRPGRAPEREGTPQRTRARTETQLKRKTAQQLRSAARRAHSAASGASGSHTRATEGPRIASHGWRGFARLAWLRAAGFASHGWLGFARLRLYVWPWGYMISMLLRIASVVSDLGRSSEKPSARLMVSMGSTPMARPTPNMTV